MKLHILSDLHLEFYNTPKEVEQLLERLFISADVLVLAGDVTSGRKVERLRDCLNLASSKYKKILYVAGNHEGYHSSYEEVEETVEVINKSYKKVEAACIQPRSVEFEGKTFHLCTLFFQERDDLDYFYYTRGMNDAHRIKTPLHEIHRYGRYSETFLMMNVTPGDIVITHHLPSYRSVPKQFYGSKTNRFYVNNISSDIFADGEPSLWIHGHTHEACDYTLARCRVVCNPVGYPGQESHFVKDLTIEI